ncbi:hypothetical protein [Flavobacterium sp. H122]|uniref:hypothetical protein n=1 Tax=Flavobacterium sp. H122 TaxID=2529860 RepID=UPI0010AA7539|nr:hypothetical protein [Flavobacterium sp. H122]
MNPLDKILNWFSSQPSYIQTDLAGLSGHFHIDQQIDLEVDSEKKIEKFKDYLNSKSLDKQEIIRRTLFITRLIPFSFSGRDTEEGWTKSYDRMVKLKNRLIEDNRPTQTADNFFDTYEEKKALWLEACESWHELIEDELTDEQLANWYFIGT